DFVNVLAIQTVIAKPSVSENVGAALYVLANLSLQSVALNVRHVDDSDLLVLAVYQSHHDRLTAPGPAGARDLALFILVHVAGESADKSFVGFDLAFKLAPECAGLHRQTHAMIHEPSRFLRDAQIAGD